MTGEARDDMDRYLMEVIGEVLSGGRNPQLHGLMDRIRE
jgi:hypothetical protein